MTPRVLIVDDRVENLLAVETVLRVLPAELVRARSGNEALLLLLRQEFAVVLLDVQMPRMDGFEVASLIRSNQRTQHVPIILVTAFGGEARHVMRGYEMGVVDFLFKPLDPDMLKSKVDVFLRLYRQGRALAVLDELRRTQAALQWAKNDLESIVRAASHDLREPARTLSMGVDMLEQDLGPEVAESVRSHVVTLRQRSQRILSILDNLAKYTDVGSDGDWSEVDLNQTVLAVTTELAQAIRAADARIEVGGLPILEGCANQLRVLLKNLISNSLKFRREGVELHIRIDAEELPAESARRDGDDREGTRFALFVRDNGIGLREGEGERLFGAFVHLQSRASLEGAHLGLSVCRRIVEHHRGSIEADGRPGEGTTVRVVLPLRQPAAEAKDED